MDSCIVKIIENYITAFISLVNLRNYCNVFILYYILEIISIRYYNKYYEIVSYNSKEFIYSGLIHLNTHGQKPVIYRQTRAVW